ncbi:hypothetical protein QQF64_034345 [Cirrhinus molitorella]|uniref:Uncharacterized protein n=1 Tax=Cirrhinus molitorella TaxID=172907 RepID=A0ABR3L1E5_9TELE
MCFKKRFARFSPRCTTVALELRHVKSLESRAVQSRGDDRTKKDAVTRIRTGVAAATTQSTNHYTITRATQPGLHAKPPECSNIQVHWRVCQRIANLSVPPKH